VASFSLGSLGFLTPFEFAGFHHTLAESFDRGVKARLRMRFECTIMRLVENGDSEDTDDQSDYLEMHPHIKKEGEHVAPETSNHHTDEYWVSTKEKTKTDWVKEEEGLNKGHRASESFSVLNELVVVRLNYENHLTLGPRSKPVFKFLGIVWR
jgi:NAD+ kinase